jgi:hypothetical protein
LVVCFGDVFAAEREAWRGNQCNGIDDCFNTTARFTVAKVAIAKYFMIACLRWLAGFYVALETEAFTIRKQHSVAPWFIVLYLS